MPIFLERVAESLLHEHLAKQSWETFASWYLVLPTRRACLYMKQYLAKIAPHSFIAPEILAADDFIVRIAGLTILDPVSLLFSLYESYRLFDSDPAHNLDRFAPLGTALLRDFDLIDKNMVEADKLFDYVEQAKAIERWAEELGQDVEYLQAKIGQNSTVPAYYQFWQYLKSTYFHFRNRLLTQGNAYLGMAYRIVAENAKQIAEQQQLQQVFFIGFNQLAAAEATIFQRFKQLGIAQFYWDTDEFYITTQPHHEAGLYLRRHQNQGLIPPDYEWGKSLTQTPKQIDVIAVSNKVTQAKLCGDLLQKAIVDKVKQPSSLAEGVAAFKQAINYVGILLPDESMLMPLLYALPDVSVDGVELSAKDYLNITMGLSIDKTPFFSLVDNLFNMQANFSTDENGKKLVYYRDIFKILRHPYLQYSTQFAQDYDKIQEHLIHIQKENLVYVPLEVLQEWGKETSFYHTVFRWWDNRADIALQTLFDLCQVLSQLFDGENNILESEFLLQFFTILKRIDSVLGEYKQQINARTLQQFLYETIRNAVVPFTGEPLSPLQLMGMLESRTLDFERLIILSCNEGIMPKGKQFGSVIPMDIRKRFGMPTHTENDATYAYTFYRLLHHAQHITLVYVDAVGAAGIHTAEKSRYITQIEAELAKHANIRLNHYRLQLELPEQASPVLKVEKTPQVLQMLREYLQNGITPSAINLYIENPLAFFQRYVLALGEPQEMEEEMLERTFGSMVHQTLEQLLKNYEQQMLTPDTLQTLAQQPNQLEELIQQAITDLKGGLVTDKGKNYLLKYIAQWLIERFLMLEKHMAPLELLAQETSLHAIITCHPPTETAPIKVFLKGTVDRIDIFNGKIRLVDYKTGTFHSKDLHAISMEELLVNPEKEKVVQLIIYKYLLLRQLQSHSGKKLPPHAVDLVNNFNIVSGFYFFRKLSEGFQPYSLKDEPSTAEEFMEYVEKFIQILVGEMLNPDIPFAQRNTVVNQSEEEL
ncbi:MAG: PD-(D/E)XK nuclease family protein [Cytophagales bacterium]|nr:PD-(D/E)XK nuclease family protein [Bernardetiaceae bacterium]MDW8204023.1 PD-(D/E)XK nuclease family protein [Cytophagales bacterium]